jgi:hypothetical protein
MNDGILHEVTCEVNASTATVWALIGHFDAMSWHPGIASGTIDSTGGKTTRRLVAQGGNPIFVEELLGSGLNFLRYEMIEGLPVQPISELSVQPIESGGTAITWRATIDTSALEAQTAQGVVSGVMGFYKAGLDSLVKKFGAVTH